MNSIDFSEVWGYLRKKFAGNKAFIKIETELGAWAVRCLRDQESKQQVMEDPYRHIAVACFGEKIVSKALNEEKLKPGHSQ